MYNICINNIQILYLICLCKYIHLYTIYMNSKCKPIINVLFDNGFLILGGILYWAPPTYFPSHALVKKIKNKRQVDVDIRYEVVKKQSSSSFILSLLKKGLEKNDKINERRQRCTESTGSVLDQCMHACAAPLYKTSCINLYIFSIGIWEMEIHSSSLF